MGLRNLNGCEIQFGGIPPEPSFWGWHSRRHDYHGRRPSTVSLRLIQPDLVLRADRQEARECTDRILDERGKPPEELPVEPVTAARLRSKKRAAGITDQGC